MRGGPRRESFRLGRWAARRLLSEVLAVAPGRLEVARASDGAPEPLLDGRRAPVELSLSHRAGYGLCVAAPPGREVGCDLELIEPRSEAFLAEYLLEPERLSVTSSGNPALWANLIWSAKETVLKAQRVGLTRDVRELLVEPAPLGDDGWGELHVTDLARGQRYSCAWTRAASLVWTTLRSQSPSTL